MYTNDGIPVYARCFADTCKTAIGDPTLFSAFLASINQFAQIDPENLPDQLDMNGITVEVNFNPEDGVNTLQLRDLQLIFMYSEVDNITISAGFNSEKYDRSEVLPIFQGFLKEVEEFLTGYTGTSWNDISTDELKEFETSLLKDVIHPFFTIHSIKDQCALGESCPFRIAIYEEQGTIFERLKAKVDEYRDKNIFQMMKMMIFKAKYALSL